MSAKSRLQKVLSTALERDEVVLAQTGMQVKKLRSRDETARTLARTAGSVALGIATAGTFTVVTSTAPSWLVVTSRRVLVLTRPEFADPEPVMALPVADVTARRKQRILSEVTIDLRADGEPLLRMNLGCKPRAARAVVAAIEGDPA
ncbi:hypothetical protein [Cellulomonas sp.]|uniref:hypothetical protein n=1 Tax=Cellulomonas sp. TaxID=40001 RepID=UPI001B0A85E7|nr:hypothetical protein [Cellulomonas sp.]MBO9553682.1 hypothetical protein [Cellulomonas sp.]